MRPGSRSATIAPGMRAHGHGACENDGAVATPSVGNETRRAAVPMPG